MIKSFSKCLAAFLSIVFAAPVAIAGGLDVSPIHVQMTATERTRTVTIQNMDELAVNIQVRAFDWAQVDGANQLTPSTALEVSPAFFALEPGEQQVVRVLAPADTGAEQSYRLFIDELPKDPTQQVGVVVPLRIILPVFATPSDSAAPQLDWSAKADGEDLVIMASNDGTARDKLSDLMIEGADGAEILKVEGLVDYVLVGTSRHWTLPGMGGASGLTITGKGISGAFSQEVAVSR